MALLFFDGFDNNPQARVTMSPSTTIGAGQGRNGTDAIVLDGTADSVQVPGSAGPIVMGFAIYPMSFVTTTNPAFFLTPQRGNDGGDGWKMTQTGAVVYDNWNDVLVSSESLPLNTWTYIELEWLMASSGYANIYFDGVQVGAYAGDTNYNVLGSELLTFFAQYSTVSYRLDDVYVLDTTGAAPFNARLGDVHVKRLAPEVAGTYSQGTGSDGNSIDNHLLVDEAPASSVDYVALAAGNRESYTVPALATGEVPLAAKVAAQVGEGGGAATVDGFLRMGGVDYAAAAAKPTSLAYNWRDFYFPINPATGVAWAEGDLTGAEIGVHRTA